MTYVDKNEVRSWLLAGRIGQQDQLCLSLPLVAPLHGSPPSVVLYNAVAFPWDM